MLEKVISTELTSVKNVNSLYSDFSKQTNDVQNMLLDAYVALQNGDINTAAAHIKNARSKDFENIEAKEAEKLLAKWIDFLRNVAVSKKYTEDIGSAIINRWYAFIKEYSSEGAQVKAIRPEGKTAFQYYIANIAKEYYIEALREFPAKRNQLAFRLKYFHCFKLLSDFDRAILFLRGTARQADTRELSYIFSQLGDCYYSIGSLYNAKAFFRRAFIYYPSGIILDELQSQMIHDILHAIVRENRYPEQYHTEYVPVYGYVIRFFDIKFKLSPLETENYKQEIYTYEAMLKDVQILGKDDPASILPRFLTKLFLLIDYYSLNQEFTQCKNEMLGKVEEYAPFIFAKLQENLEKQKNSRKENK